MAITKYTKPMQQEFVPKPWEQMYKMQMLKRQEFEAAENMLDTGYDLLSSVRATGEEDKALLATERQRYDKVIKEAISGAGGDLSLLPRVAKNIARDIRSNIQSGKLYDINRKTSQVINAAELTNKQRAEGKLNDADFYNAQKQHAQGNAYISGQSVDWKQKTVDEMDNFGKINEGVTYNRAFEITRDFAWNTFKDEHENRIQYLIEAKDYTQEAATREVMNDVGNLAKTIARKETSLSTNDFNIANASHPFIRKLQLADRYGSFNLSFDELKATRNVGAKDNLQVDAGQLVIQPAYVYGIMAGTSDEEMSDENRTKKLEEAVGKTFPGANRHNFFADESQKTNSFIVDGTTLTWGYIYVSKMEFDSDTELEGFFNEYKDNPDIIQRTREMKDPAMKDAPNKEWYRVSVMLKTDLNSKSILRNYNVNADGWTKKESAQIEPGQETQMGEYNYLVLESKKLKRNPQDYIKEIKSKHKDSDDLYKYLDKLSTDKTRHNYDEIVKLYEKFTK